MVQRRLNGLIFTLLIWPYYWLRMYIWWPLRDKPENRIADIGRLIDLRPDYAPFYLKRAWWLAHARHNIEQGFADCDKARQINPTLDQASLIHRTRAHLYLGLDDVASAISHLDLALKADPTERATYFFRAYLHQTQGQLAQAIADYRQGLKHDFGMDRPQYADIYVKIGQLYLQMAEDQKALEEFEKAAGYSPQNLDALQGRIHAHAIREDIDAMNAQISTIPPRKLDTLAHALGTRGHVYIAQGLYTQAMEDFEQALLIHDCWQMYINRGMGHLHLENHDAAMRDMQQGVQLHPNSAHAHNSLGFTALLAGDIEAASAAIDKALMLCPTFEPAYDSRGHLHLLLGDYTAALEDFEAAMKGYPQESTRISAMAGQAVAHYALNDADTIDTAVAQWRALCERHADRDLLVYLREQMVWPSRSLELAEQLNALTFPSSSPSP